MIAQRPEHIQRFEAAFCSKTPAEELHRFAVSLRDEGVAQIEVYMLFEHFQISTSADDPKYDAIADTMELIFGGPWAKGRDIFPKALTEEEIKESRRPNK